mmetsp:Transcript_25795/g.43805  ORF Transcript_25795/g.43805 Transcript_25795/m.43805 type:complete len:89 (-) Transcript_25795:1187-1453(-)
MTDGEFFKMMSNEQKIYKPWRKIQHLFTLQNNSNTQTIRESTISRISPIAVNDVSGQLKNTDDFDLALMALMIHAVYVSATSMKTSFT